MNLETPEVHYARSGDVSIAYQVVGEGPVDLLFVPFMINLVWAWEQPVFVDFCRRLADFSRLILLDKRGTGLSDRPRDLPSFETRMDDIRAVMDDAGSDRAALLGAGSPGGQLCAVFAATYPERVVALMLHNTWPRVVSAPDYPIGRPVEEWHRRVRETRLKWGDREYQLGELRKYVPSHVGDAEFEHWYVNHERLAASPGRGRLVPAGADGDRHPRGASDHHGPHAAHVPGPLQERLPLPRRAHTARRGPRGDLAGHQHLRGAGSARRGEALPGGRACRHRARARPDHRPLHGHRRVDLARGRARRRRWRALLEAHHAAVRAQLARYGGREVRSTGDGFFATFDGPARAIACAHGSITAVGQLGLDVRAGIHTGEVELAGGKVEGIAVHIGARIAAEARPCEVLVSSIVRDLAAGSGIDFEERGVKTPQGRTRAWKLYAARLSDRARIG